MCPNATSKDFQHVKSYLKLLHRKLIQNKCAPKIHKLLSGIEVYTLISHCVNDNTFCMLAGYIYSKQAIVISSALNPVHFALIFQNPSPGKTKPAPFHAVQTDRTMLFYHPTIHS